MNSNDEKILVIKKELLFGTSVFQGFRPLYDFDAHQKLIMQHKQFLWRSAMENDSAYKQIIPYLVFCNNHHYFVMRRKSTASEARLKDKYSLGIGGHIRQEDMQDASLITWAQREFGEEVNYTGNLAITPLGMINDDSSSVGQVHAGFAFLLEGDSANISIKDEHKQGDLLTLENMQPLYKKMESWSQLVFDFLVQKESQGTVRPAARALSHEP